MKQLIIIIVMAAGLAHGQGALPLPPLHTTTATNNFTNTVIISDHIINALIENGDVCRVRGKHEWRYQAFNGAYVFMTESDSKGRKCDLCGRKETKQEEWKEDGQ